MAAIVDNLRGTLAGVLDVSQHIVWYVDWQTGNRRSARRSSAPVHAAQADPHALLVDAR